MIGNEEFQGVDLKGKFGADDREDEDDFYGIVFR